MCLYSSKLLQFYSLYDCDIMSELENQISIFKQKGQVILLGDTNARTSNLDDFLVCDVLHNDVLKALCELIYYQKPMNLSHVETIRILL